MSTDLLSLRDLDNKLSRPPEKEEDAARQRPGEVRWVVERTIAWLKGLRRVRVRYDRLGVIVDAWTALAASVICFRILHQDAL